ncbi:hypothetical protein Tco_0783727 [Tanacetum coccineum]
MIELSNFDVQRPLLKDADHGSRCIDTPAKSTSGGIPVHVVRLGINPMIQPEPEDLPKDNPKLEIAVLRYNIYTVKRSSQNRRYKRWCCGPTPAESNSLPHAHAQTTKTYYWHQDSRIKKAQVYIKIKTFANSDIQDLPLRYQVYQGRLLASFLDYAKYEHVGQDTRSQDGKDGKDLKEKI